MHRNLKTFGSKFATRLPAGIMPRQLNSEELFQPDLQSVKKKVQMKEQADGKKGMKTSEIQVGDAVLVKQESNTKATPPFEREPLEVHYQKGTQVVTKRINGTFSMVPY